MSDFETKIPVNSAANDPAFVSEALSSVLDRTHEAAGNIVSFADIEAKEVGIRALGRAANILHWFRSDVTPAEVAEYAGIIDALTRRRQEIIEAANDESSEKAA